MKDLLGVQHSNKAVVGEIQDIFNSHTEDIKGQFAQDISQVTADIRNAVNEKKPQELSFLFWDRKEDNPSIEKRILIPMFSIVTDAMFEGVDEAFEADGIKDGKYLYYICSVFNINPEELFPVLDTASKDDKCFMSTLHRYLFPAMARVLENLLMLKEGSAYLFVYSEGIGLAVTPDCLAIPDTTAGL